MAMRIEDMDAAHAFMRAIDMHVNLTCPAYRDGRTYYTVIIDTPRGHVKVADYSPSPCTPAVDYPLNALAVVTDFCSAAADYGPEHGRDEFGEDGYRYYTGLTEGLESITGTDIETLNAIFQDC